MKLEAIDDLTSLQIEKIRMTNARTLSQELYERNGSELPKCQVFGETCEKKIWNSCNNLDEYRKKVKGVLINISNPTSKDNTNKEKSASFDDKNINNLIRQKTGYFRVLDELRQIILKKFPGVLRMEDKFELANFLSITEHCLTYIEDKTCIDTSILTSLFSEIDKISISVKEFTKNVVLIKDTYK